MDRAVGQIRWISHYLGPHIQCPRHHIFRESDVHVPPTAGDLSIVAADGRLHSMAYLPDIFGKPACNVPGVPPQNDGAHQSKNHQFYDSDKKRLLKNGICQFHYTYPWYDYCECDCNRPVLGPLH